MTNGNGVSRGDRNRNSRLARLRQLVPVSNAIVGGSARVTGAPRTSAVSDSAGDAVGTRVGHGCSCHWWSVG